MPDDIGDDLHWDGLAGLLDAAFRGPIATFRYEPPGWTARGTVTRTDQGLVISHLEIDPSDDSAGITITIMRGFPVREVLSHAQAMQASALMHPAARRGHRPVEPPLNPAATRTPGRAPLTDDFLRQVAVDYLEETAPGKPRGAIARLTERYGKPAPTVARWVGRARDAGWLGPAAPGREGGEPGPRMLDAHRD